MPREHNIPPKPQLEWRQQASDDLARLVEYIADDNPDAAQKLKDEIESKAAQLPDHPKTLQIIPSRQEYARDGRQEQFHHPLSRVQETGRSGECVSRKAAMAKDGVLIEVF